jgi:hypothetical protein
LESAILERYPYKIIHDDHISMTKFKGRDSSYTNVSLELMRWVKEMNISAPSAIFTQEDWPSLKPSVDRYWNGTERGLLTNGSGFAISNWSCVNPSNPTKESIDDVSMGTLQDEMSAYDSILDALSLQENAASHNPSTYNPAFLRDAWLTGEMSLASDFGRNHSAFLDEMWISGPGISGDAGLSSIPHHPGVYPASNDPWNWPGVVQDNDGFVAFSNSTKSSSDQSGHNVSFGPSFSPQGSMIHAPQGARVEKFPLESIDVTNQNQFQLGIISTVTHGPPKLGEMAMRNTDLRQRKRRHGQLDIRNRKEAVLVRKEGVCWPCRVSKAKASLPNAPRTKFLLTNLLSARRAALARDVKVINHLYRI